MFHHRYLCSLNVAVFILLAGTWIPATGEEQNITKAALNVLETHCLACHNNVDEKGGFSLQTRDSLIESGHVKAGHPLDSLLFAAVSGSQDEPPSMPKDASRLTQQELSVLREWIEAGAEWPAGYELQEPALNDFDWWSFQPLKRPTVPTFAADSDEARWIRTPIDAFIADAHRQHGLAHSAEADKRTLIRRLTYDLTGLPPSPEDITTFVGETDARAYDRLVERLLASDHYGERWARHWLDVVKYADTCGYDKDKLRPNAWPYRDYVIRSLNEDKDYTRFVHEQIAGDILFPGHSDGILGLGFIAAGPWDFIGHVEVPDSKIDGRLARNLDRDDMVSNTINTFCSATIQCARCHNHKFDPFTQEHYYSLQSVFAAVDRAERVYNLEPAIEKKRNELLDSLAELNAQLKKIDQDCREEGGPELAALLTRISELKPLAVLSEKPAEFGYHSRIEASRDVEKWVEVDLGRAVPISRIVLHASHDEFNGIGAGFGFPVRFRIDVLAGPQESVKVADFTGEAFANPGLQSVDVPLDGVTARVVRVTVTELAERQSDFIFALAELEVFDSEGTNVAEGAVVQALDSIEEPARWRKSNLTDGLRPLVADPEAVRALASAEQQRVAVLSRCMTPERVAQKEQLEEQRDAADEQLKNLPAGDVVYAAATYFKPQANFKPTKGVPRPVTVLHRGNIQQPGETVRPGAIPLSMNDIWQFDLGEEHSEADRRAAIARWITRPDNPLTWRSIVSRIWQYHFGRGIVDSPNDFGRMGQLPTHPELLDWLAVEFRDNGQSFKHIHRLIVTSATWKQASTHNEAASQIDGSNQYLWRQTRRRLSAEELRDSVLAVSGKLNPEMGGPGFYLFVLEKTDHSPHFEYHKFDPDDAASHRRSVYRFIARSQPNPFMTTLDCADSSQSTPRRNETFTPLQALSLLNNRFTLTMAGHFAERVRQAGEEDTQRVRRVFELTTGRSPEPDELQPLLQYADRHGMTAMCRLLFNLNEFVFVD